MFRIIVTIIFFISAFLSFGQNLNCSRFRNGNFEINDETGQTLVIRKRNVQTEIMKGQKVKSRLRVEWIDECTYTLRPTKRTLRQSGGRVPSNALLTVTIIEVRPNSYIQVTTSNFFKNNYTSEMVMIESYKSPVEVIYIFLK